MPLIKLAEWRKRNREIFDLYLKYKVRYRVSYPPDRDLLTLNGEKVTLGKGMVYNSVNRFRKLRLFDNTGNLTSLGVNVKGIKDYVLKFGSARCKYLERIIGRESIEAGLKAGLFYEERKKGRLIL